MYQKNIILFVILIFCLNACISVKNDSLKSENLQETKLENTMKYPDEIRKLFNDLPVDLGIEKVLEESDVFFEYAKTIHILSYSEVWFTELDTFTYFLTKADKVELRLERSFDKLDDDFDGEKLNCYKTMLKFFYANDDVMKNAFFENISIVRDFGEIKDDAMRYEDYEFIERITEIGLIQNKEMPTVHILGNVGSDFFDPQIVVVFENCLN